MSGRSSDCFTARRALGAGLTPCERSWRRSLAQIRPRTASRGCRSSKSRRKGLATHHSRSWPGGNAQGAPAQEPHATAGEGTWVRWKAAPCARSRTRPGRPWDRSPGWRGRSPSWAPTPPARTTPPRSAHTCQPPKLTSLPHSRPALSAARTTCRAPVPQELLQALPAHPFQHHAAIANPCGLSIPVVYITWGALVRCTPVR